MSSNDDPQKLVKVFKYLRSRMESKERNIMERKASAWRALNDLKKIWISSLPKGLKTWIFVAAIDAVLLYSCEAWTLTHDGCYIQMLWVVFNISWQQHITSTELYGDLPTVSVKVAARRPK